MEKMMYILILLLSISIAGCGKKQVELPETEVLEEVKTEQEMIVINTIPIEEEEIIPEVAEINLGDYFKNLNGCAVFYNQQKNKYYIYNESMANERRSPCSTHKIVTGLLGLENGVIDPDDSIRKWSGEEFWNEDWNRDINFIDAFQKSCVWYFREVVNALGENKIEEGLKNLEYGNCDISDWQGKLNTSNNNRALTGYWIESSLLISPREQVEVLKRIFGEDSEYSAENIEYLKKAMLTDQQENRAIYGKTGAGKKDGVFVDAWFVGFEEENGTPVYFAIYLGKSENEIISGKKAKEIAENILYNEILHK